MPKPRKPYTQKETTRHGKTVWYFRRGKEKRIRLQGQFGSPEFNATYEAALLGQTVERKKAAPKKHSCGCVKLIKTAPDSLDYGRTLKGVIGTHFKIF